MGSLGEAVVEVGADASRFRSDVNRDVSGALDAATRNAQRSVWNISRIAQRAAVVGFGALAYGAGAFVKSSIDAERTFSTTMRLIQASTKASSDEISRMNDLAIDLGQATSFSAQEAAGSMLELAKAGVTTADIMGGGVEGTLLLAAAGGTELSVAATIASNALNTFNLEGRDMAKVAAALAGGANASSASVDSLGQALQQVGPGATNAGLSLQETVAVLAAFDSAGIKGSDAGTSLKTMLTRLVPQTDKAKNAMADLGLKFTDAEGNFLSITEISQQLQDALAGLTEEERTRALATIFGSDATRAATVLMKEGADGLQQFIDATMDSNAAQKMAKARLSGTEGALERLSGSIETAKLRLGQELAPVIEDIADGLSKRLVPTLEGALDGAKALGEAVAPVVSEIAESLRDLGGSGDSVTSMFDTFISLVRTASEIIGGAIGVFNDLPGPLKEIAVQGALAAAVLPRVTAGIVGVTAAAKGSAVGTFVTSLRGAETQAARTSVALGGLKSVAQQAAGIGGLLALSSGLSEASSEGNSFSSVMKSAAGGAGIGAMFGPIGALVGAGAGAGLGALVGAFGGAQDAAKETRLELMKSEGFKNASDDAASLSDALVGVVKAYGQIPRAAVKASFTGEDGKLDKDIGLLRDLGVSMDTIVSATLGQANAQRLVNDALTAGLGPAQASLDTLKARYDDAKDGAIDLVTASGQVYANAQQIDAATLANYKTEYESAKVTVEDLIAAQAVFGDRISKNTGAIRDHKAQVLALATDLGLTVQQYREFPKEVRTKIEGDGLPQTNQDALRLIRQYQSLQSFKSIRALISAPGVQLTEAQVKSLKKQYDLTPKQVRTLFRLEGIDRVKGDTDKVRNNLKNAGNVKVDASTFTQSVKNMMSVGGGIVDRDGGKVKKGLRDAGKTKIDKQWQSSLEATLNQAKTLASSGGRQIGTSMKSGVEGGLSGLMESLSSKVRAAVNAAIAAGKQAADAHSPSRKMWQLGLDLINGLTGGVEENGPKAVKAMVDQLTTLEDKTKEKLGSLREEFTSLAESISSAFAPDLFQATSLADFIDQGSSAYGELVNVRKAFKTLKGWGIDPKFLAQLFASGNAALILDMAEGSKRDARQASGIFADIAQLTGKLGEDVAKNVLGPKIDRTNHILNQIRDVLAALKDSGKNDKGNGNRNGGNTAARPIPAAAAASAGAVSGASPVDAAVVAELQSLRAEVRALTAVTASGPNQFGNQIRGVVSDAKVRAN